MLLCIDNSALCRVSKDVERQATCLPSPREGGGLFQMSSPTLPAFYIDSNPISGLQPNSVSDQDIINSCKESAYDRAQCIRFHAQCFNPVSQHRVTLQDCKADFEEKKSEQQQQQQQQQPTITDQDVEASCKESAFGRQQCIQFHAKCFRPVREGETTLDECKADFQKDIIS
ncbi:hypothetical protein L249_3667 [Ophiocordyceps polyrhachis-furcata BCC 54312]|uniref:Uncharacterized protein n=1 Tax=Ophiocordyceps polyrhachis-furcata BCC 54312 TaxID=1330021 RepID=A0A367L4N6_9HYPO|nr:hypothetical protein L249_3667 [Ophiocordyceps polyrhachis-furcata BCC 54312]